MQKLCGARTRAGGICQRPPVAGRERCRAHGRASPIGVGSPHFRHGRYSKALPTRLAARYAEAEQDGELLALRSDIALIDARLADLLARVDTGESGAIWRRARDAYQTSIRLSQAGDPAGAAESMRELGRLLTQGQADYAVWDEIGRALDRRRALVESERRRLVEMQQMITTERAMVLLGVVVDTIRKHVTDRTALAAISSDLRQLVAG